MDLLMAFWPFPRNFILVLPKISSPFVGLERWRVDRRSAVQKRLQKLGFFLTVDILLGQESLSLKMSVRTLMRMSTRLLLHVQKNETLLGADLDSFASFHLCIAFSVLQKVFKFYDKTDALLQHSIQIFPVFNPLLKDLGSFLIKSDSWLWSFWIYAIYILIKEVGFARCKISFHNLHARLKLFSSFWECSFRWG